jgi:hypothetical protein
MRVPLSIYRLTPPDGWNHDDLIDEWNDKAARFEILAGLSRGAAETMALAEVIALCEAGHP